ncbi:hypothetical protein BJV78DRAFT_202214 [Lactifluus subvellereus]|nr:hypothetical protein BJV78DRAFT_202214 [Lactifluus subvellereus]
MHVKTDIFCSGAVVLPDKWPKAARVLNVGGYSDTSTFGVRLYAPDGSPGVNGTNGCEEDPNTLQLHWQVRLPHPALQPRVSVFKFNCSSQCGRWYPTALVMANGSVLAVGGETGPKASHSMPRPMTLEILPRIPGPGSNTQVFLSWLGQTDPNNLYPFLHVLPLQVVSPLLDTTMKHASGCSIR